METLFDFTMLTEDDASGPSVSFLCNPVFFRNVCPSQALGYCICSMQSECRPVRHIDQKMMPSLLFTCFFPLHWHGASIECSAFKMICADVAALSDHASRTLPASLPDALGVTEG